MCHILYKESPKKLYVPQLEMLSTLFQALLSTGLIQDGPRRIRRSDFANLNDDICCVDVVEQD